MSIKGLTYLIVILATTLTSCRKELDYEDRDVNIDIEINANSIELNFLWNINWETDLLFPWDEAVYGPLGYSTPKGVRINIYRQTKDGIEYMYNVNSILGYTPLNLSIGDYSLLFYNNDTEYILFDNNSDKATIIASTRTTTRTRSRADNTTDTIHISTAPDILYRSTIDDFNITENMEDYTLVNGVWVKTAYTDLTPAVFIYMVEVIMHNNRGRVIGATQMYLSGMAGSVDLRKGITGSEDVYISNENVHFAQDSMLCSRYTTFGLCETSPISRAENNISRLDISNTLTTILKLKNGKQKSIECNITEQMRKHLTGGVIILNLDMDKIITDEDMSSSGAFDIDVDPWGDVVNIGFEIK